MSGYFYKIFSITYRIKDWIPHRYQKLSAPISVNKAELQMPLKNAQALVSLSLCSPLSLATGTYST